MITYNGPGIRIEIDEDEVIVIHGNGACATLQYALEHSELLGNNADDGIILNRKQQQWLLDQEEIVNGQ